MTRAEINKISAHSKSICLEKFKKKNLTYSQKQKGTLNENKTYRKKKS